MVAAMDSFPHQISQCLIVLNEPVTPAGVAQQPVVGTQNLLRQTFCRQNPSLLGLPCPLRVCRTRDEGLYEGMENNNRDYHIISGANKGRRGQWRLAGHLGFGDVPGPSQIPRILAFIPIILGLKAVIMG